MVKHTETIRRRILWVSLTILWGCHLKGYINFKFKELEIVSDVLHDLIGSIFSLHGGNFALFIHQIVKIVINSSKSELTCEAGVDSDVKVFPQIFSFAKSHWHAREIFTLERSLVILCAVSTSSKSNGTPTHNHLVHERTLNHLAKFG